MLSLQPSPGNRRHLWGILSLVLGVISYIGGGPQSGMAKDQKKIPFVIKNTPLQAAEATRAEAAGQTAWNKLETAYTVIYYQNRKDLKQFHRKVDFSPFRSSLKNFLADSPGGDLPDMVKRKTDALYERVQEILGMRKRLPKINIKIFSDKNQFNLELQGQGGAKDSVRAWYRYETKTAHFSVRDVNEGILAHEMAHHVIDHYLTVRPPRASAEILARYVDEHLFY